MKTAQGVYQKLFRYDDKKHDEHVQQKKKNFSLCDGRQVM